MKQKLKKDLTIEDFQSTTYVSYEQIERIMGKRRFKKFMNWMAGQTVPADYCPDCKQLICVGVYPWDLENFLQPEHKQFFD